MLSSWCCRETIAKKTRLDGYYYWNVLRILSDLVQAQVQFFKEHGLGLGPVLWCKFTLHNKFIYENNLRHFIIIIIFVIWIFENNFGSCQIWQENISWKFLSVWNFWLAFNDKSNDELEMFESWKKILISIRQESWNIFESCSTLNSWQIIYGMCHWSIFFLN